MNKQPINEKIINLMSKSVNDMTPEERYQFEIITGVVQMKNQRSLCQIYTIANRLGNKQGVAANE